ncbi:MAG TPA: FecR family protein [Chitinophaga sp.]|uniref:FecR family protein n=1 Tax=Chitinophaga sp. TaxID=1869181 RepID=UPI002DC04CB4|nr:FecR family protein [Chitinophaga sp.]HEU4555410.1 FecR family protein [Chitinophaga sp.]
MNQPTIIALLEKYARGTASPEEAAQVTRWLQQTSPEEFDAILALSNLPEEWKALPPISPEFAGRLETRLDAQEAGPMPVRRGIIYLKRMAAAAAVLLLAAGAFYWLRRPAPQPVAQVTPKNNPAPLPNAPGGNHAVLTLADGSSITLDSAQNGVLAQQGNTRIIKLNNGQLAYNPPAAANSSAAVFNTITTPAGGQYQLTLPDGSKVWLNAASSLRFPNHFTGNERSVELHGEGYFEIAHNKDLPFRVKVNDAVVEVLGTHFNVNAYSDEADVRTTLLEGAVKMSKGTASVLLAPGQQARLQRNGSMNLVKHADLEQAMAWKNGYFQFDKADLPTLMRQIARWYNLEVVYEGPVKNYEFVGKIARNVYLADVLKALESSGVHYRMEGRRLVIIS